MIRQIRKIQKENVVVKVVYDPDFDEYQVKLYTDGKLDDLATYFTSDLADAKGTADHMLSFKLANKE